MGWGGWRVGELRPYILSRVYVAVATELWSLVLLLFLTCNGFSTPIAACINFYVYIVLAMALAYNPSCFFAPALPSYLEISVSIVMEIIAAVAIVFFVAVQPDSVSNWSSVFWVFLHLPDSCSPSGTTRR